jgi:hypothetical protein
MPIVTVIFHFFFVFFFFCKGALDMDAKTSDVGGVLTLLLGEVLLPIVTGGVLRGPQGGYFPPGAPPRARTRRTAAPSTMCWQQRLHTAPVPVPKHPGQADAGLSAALDRPTAVFVRQQYLQPLPSLMYMKARLFGVYCSIASD